LLKKQKFKPQKREDGTIQALIKGKQTNFVR